jgi:hypothetical protein
MGPSLCTGICPLFISGKAFPANYSNYKKQQLRPYPIIKRANKPVQPPSHTVRRMMHSAELRLKRALVGELSWVCSEGEVGEIVAAFARQPHIERQRVRDVLYVVAVAVEPLVQ